MNKIIKITLAAALLLSMGASVANADPVKGQKLYQKKLKSPCGFTGAKMAQKHSQDEWEELNDDGEIAAEIKRICPKTPSSALKDKYIPHYYDFFYEYANDSGNVPSC